MCKYKRKRKQMKILLAIEEIQGWRKEEKLSQEKE